MSASRNINPHLARTRQQQGPPHQQPQIVRTNAQEANYGGARNIVLQGSQQSRPPLPRLPQPPHGVRSGGNDQAILDDEDDEEEEEEDEEEPDTSDEEDAEGDPEQAEEGDEDGEDGEDDEAEDSEEREERERAHQAQEITSMVRSAEASRLRRPHVHPTIRVAGSASVASPTITVASRPPLPPTSASSPASRNTPQIQVLPASHNRATNNLPSNHVNPLNAPAHIQAQLQSGMDGTRLPSMTEDLTRLSSGDLTTLRTFLARSNETVLRLLDASRQGPGLPISSSIPSTNTTTAPGAGVRMRPTLSTLMDNMPTTKQKTFPLQCGATIAIDPFSPTPKSAVEPSKQSSGLGSGPRSPTSLRARRKANRASYPSSSYEFAMSSLSPGGERDEGKEDEDEDMSRIQKNTMRGKKVKTITNGCGALLHPSGYLSTARASTLSLSNIIPTEASGLTSSNNPNATTTTATINANPANTVANAAGVGLNEATQKGVYIARGHATDAVVKLSRGYFEGSAAYCGLETCVPSPGARTTDACGSAPSGYVGGYSSSGADYGASGAPMMTAKEGRMQCGCEWYGVGCRHCGLPLGEVYNACSRHVLPGSGSGNSSGGTTPSPTSSSPSVSPSVSPSRHTPEQQKEKVMKQQRRKGPTPLYTFDASSVTPRLPVEPEGGWERLQGISDDSNEEGTAVSPVNVRSTVPPPTATSPTALSFASSPPPSPHHARNGPSGPSSPISPSHSSAPPVSGLPNPALVTQRATAGPTIRVLPVQQQRAGGPRSFGISMRSVPASHPRQLPVPNTGMSMQWSPSTYSGGSAFGGGAGFHTQTHPHPSAHAHTHVVSPAPPRTRGASHGSNSGSDTGTSDNSGSGSSLSATGSNTSSSAQESARGSSSSSSPDRSPAGSGSATPASEGVRQNAAV